METTGWLSILPPVLAIILAIRTKHVYVSLTFGIWLGWTIISGGNPVSGFIKAIDSMVAVFLDDDKTRIILFVAMIGAVIAFTQYSGGMKGFVNWIVDRKFMRSKKSAGLLAWFLGLVIFIESNICVLVSGAVSRPLFDRLKISREKLAYILDSTSAPKCIIIPLNAWGAFVIGLLGAQGIANPVKTFLTSIPLNFYALIAITLVLFIILSGKDIGPMKKAEKRVRNEGKLLRDGAEPLVAEEVASMEEKKGIPLRAANMLIPIAAMIITMPAVLIISGKGDMLKGSGSLSVFWSVLVSLILAAALYRLQGIMRLREITDVFMKGVGGLVPLALLMVLAFAIGDTCDALGTGPFVAQAARATLPIPIIPAVVYVLSCIIAFSTGTSWGTFAIMIPIAVPMMNMLDLHSGIMIGAVLSGAIFGDHCSPISDTTIISSMAAATDHIDHVRTQLPYALIAGGIALILFLCAGFFT